MPHAHVLKESHSTTRSQLSDHAGGSKCCRNSGCTYKPPHAAGFKHLADPSSGWGGLWSDGIPLCCRPVMHLGGMLDGQARFSKMAYAAQDSAYFAFQAGPKCVLQDHHSACVIEPYLWLSTTLNLFNILYSCILCLEVTSDVGFIFIKRIQALQSVEVTTSLFRNIVHLFYKTWPSWQPHLQPFDRRFALYVCTGVQLHRSRSSCFLVSTMQASAMAMCAATQMTCLLTLR